MSTEEEAFVEKRNLQLHNQLRRKLKDFNTRWGDIVQLSLSIAAVITGVVLIVIALTVRQLTIDNGKKAKQATVDARSADVRSKKQCNRSKLIGPYLVKDYEMRHVMPVDILKVYRDTIPKKC